MRGAHVPGPTVRVAGRVADRQHRGMGNPYSRFIDRPGVVCSAGILPAQALRILRTAAIGGTPTAGAGWKPALRFLPCAMAVRSPPFARLGRPLRGLGIWGDRYLGFLRCSAPQSPQATGVPPALRALRRAAQTGRPRRRRTARSAGVTACSTDRASSTSAYRPLCGRYGVQHKPGDFDVGVPHARRALRQDTRH